MKSIKTKKHDAIVLSNLQERDRQNKLARLLKTCPIPDDEILPNLGLYLTSKNLSRLLFFYEIYQKILNTHGVIIEFGVRWGQTMSLLSALRGILEPFNRHRKIVGFDTFQGFIGLEPKDGRLCKCKDGSFSVPPAYEQYLDSILKIQEQLNPVNQIKKYEIVKGNAIETIPSYFAAHPEMLVSLVIFDFDIYQPTRAAMEAVKPCLCKGSILVFDELGDEYFPGETIALREVFGLETLRIERLPMTARISFAQIV